jgi:hypothetical protein
MTESVIPSHHQTRCATPGCTEPVPRGGRGRPALYHSPACRAAAYRRARQDPHAPLTVEIDHRSTNAQARPAGRVWLVRLRRGDQAVIVAAGLSRPSADALAHQINQLLHPARLAKGGAID